MDTGHRFLGEYLYYKFWIPPIVSFDVEASSHFNNLCIKQL
jgi:hypothetical protein